MIYLNSQNLPILIVSKVLSASKHSSVNATPIVASFGEKQMSHQNPNESTLGRRGALNNSNSKVEFDAMLQHFNKQITGHIYRCEVCTMQ